MYIRIEDGTPKNYNIKHLSRDYPHISFPDIPTNEMLEEFDIYPLVEVTPPFDTITEGTQLVSGTPIFEDGVWKQTWNLVESETE